jgi:hypothetical protein
MASAPNTWGYPPTGRAGAVPAAAATPSSRDGFFDVQERQTRHSAYDGQGPVFEVGFSLDVTDQKPPGQ